VKVGAGHGGSGNAGGDEVWSVGVSGTAGDDGEPRGRLSVG